MTDAHASGEPEGYVNYSNYELTILKDVLELPVERDDNAQFLTMTEDGFVSYVPEAPIPFFGNEMSAFFIAANGYIADYDDLFDADEWSSTGYYNFPSFQTHFEVPRISFLFSDLSQDSGGTVWTKLLPDRVVVTFERVPEFGSLRGNTAQVELYYSGRIRITLLEINAKNVVVGLSDGNGITTARVKQTDLSDEPIPSVLSIDPIAPIFASEGEEIRFTVVGRAPDQAVPTFTAGFVGSTGLLDPLPDGATFTPPSGAATNTTEFVWTPAFDQGGYYVLRTIFASGGQEASQDVQIFVGDNIRPPRLEPDGTGGDVPPEITPAFPLDDDTLRASYLYYQEDGVPEGASTIYWYRNGVYIAAFTNQLEVPANYTSVGEQWHFIVIPTTINGLEGEPHMSNVVTVAEEKQSDVNKDGVTDAIDLQMVINSVLGAAPPVAPVDINGDGAIDAVDVQELVHAVLQD
jgi:hypothetical protein